MINKEKLFKQKSHKKSDAIEYYFIKQACDNLDSKKILPESSDLIALIKKRKFEIRLNNLWADLNKRISFLRVISVVLSCTESDFCNIRQSFFFTLLKSTFITTIVNDNVVCLQSKDLENKSVNNMLNYLLVIILCGFETYPTLMNQYVQTVQSILYVFSNLPKNSLQNLQKIVSEIKEKLLLMLDDRHNCKTEAVKSTLKPCKPPNDSFRNISIMPTTNDLVDSQIFLRVAKKIGSYKNDEHYLDVQFRLLREDALRPLREGILSCRLVEKSKTNLFIYQNVKISKAEFNIKQGIFINYVQFIVHSKMRWDKRLKFGSLVCLSSDNFMTNFVFGVVWDRDKILNQSKVGLKINGFFKCNYKYNMIESPAFFEAYRPVMSALQSFAPNKPIPFSKYFVAVKVNETKPPNYIIEQKTFDFSSILKNKLENNCHYNPYTISTTLKPDDFGMDKSQFDALCYALKTDLSIIQGPPGTGKSFLGLQLVNLLLKNKKFISSPILLVCYTNHALDQFMENIIKSTKSFCKNIVRIGGQSKNPELELINIKIIRQKYRNKYDIDYKFNNEIYYKVKNIKQKLLLLHQKRQSCNEGYFDKNHTNSLPKYLNENVIEQFERMDNNEIAQWLGFCNKNIECILPQIKNVENEDIAGEYFQLADDNQEEIFFELIEGNKKNEKETKTVSKKMQEIYKQIALAPVMTDNKATSINNIYEINLQNRWKFAKFILATICEDYNNEIKNLENELIPLMEIYEEEKMLKDIKILQNFDLIGLTTTGAAKFKTVLRSLNSQIVVVEEAAEVLEAHIISCLTLKCQHLILIGDHKQLRPNLAVYELAKKYNFEISLFERMVNNNYPYCILKNQHRMCPLISRTLMTRFYPQLKDDNSVYLLKNVRGVTNNLFFINHNYTEQTDLEFQSHINEFEAKYAVELANYFVLQGYNEKSITILTTYLDQILMLKRMASNKFSNGHQIQISSVDNYQGEENDIIILSLVRSNNSENKIGFLSTDNRVCVAFSRAKQGLYVISNLDFLANNCRTHLWQDIHDRASKANCVGNGLPVVCELHNTAQFIINPEDFLLKCPEGGCTIPCNFRLQCGHVCSMPCHVKDAQHSMYKCLKPCPKKCIVGHPCKKQCFEKCKCTEKIIKKLRCGHSQKVCCYLDENMVDCICPCPKFLSCGHKCDKLCNQMCTLKCIEKMDKKNPLCGHVNNMFCYCDPSQVRCKKIIEKQWPYCGHIVETECCTDVLEKPCNKPCNAVLPNCEHLCSNTCGECRNGRLHKACNKECGRTLICGHICNGKCCVSCPPCQRQCETACKHSQCCNKLSSNNKNGRLCFESCPACSENCSNVCKHRKCSKLCGEVCDIEPCIKPCKKKLPCSPKTPKDNLQNLPHLCIGICGEKCPKICAICNKEKFENEVKEIFFGYEDQDDACFIQLPDCGHIIESRGLDMFIKNSIAETNTEDIPNAIVQIACPKCKTLIRKSSRYVSILNKRALTIEKIKEKIREDSNVILIEKFNNFSKKINLFDCFNINKGINFKESDKFKEALKKIISQLKKKPNFLTANYIRTIENVFNIVNRLAKHSIQLEKETFHNFDVCLNSEIVKVCHELNVNSLNLFLWKDLIALVSCLDIMSAPHIFLLQIICEINRFEFLFNLFKWIEKAVFSLNTDLKQNTITDKDLHVPILKNIFVEINSSKMFDGEHKAKLESAFNDLQKTIKLSVTKEEILQIKQSLSRNITNWYECPNGHPYGIGDCGGAMETSKCADCGAIIGGTRHRVDASNRASSLNERVYSFPPGVGEPE